MTKPLGGFQPPSDNNAVGSTGSRLAVWQPGSLGGCYFAGFCFVCFVFYQMPSQLASKQRSRLCMFQPLVWQPARHASSRVDSPASNKTRRTPWVLCAVRTVSVQTCRPKTMGWPLPQACGNAKPRLLLGGDPL